LSYLDSNQE